MDAVKICGGAAIREWRRELCLAGNTQIYTASSFDVLWRCCVRSRPVLSIGCIEHAARVMIDEQFKITNMAMESRSAERELDVVTSCAQLGLQDHGWDVGGNTSCAVAMLQLASVHKGAI
jgi:hypothetical protein